MYEICITKLKKEGRKKSKKLSSKQKRTFQCFGRNQGGLFDIDIFITHCIVR